MSTSDLPSFCGRNTNQEMQEQKAMIMRSLDVLTLMNAIPDPFMILNDKRQIVCANDKLAKLLEIENIDAILGLRPGEILNCVNADKNDAGCGESEACEFCGNLSCIQKSLEDGKTHTNTSRVLTKDTNVSLDLVLNSTPYTVEGHKFLLFSVKDNSDQMRRNNLERIFFHDIINIADGLKHISAILFENPDEFPHFKDMVYELSHTLVDEIVAQKQLLAAENQQLAVNFTTLNSLDLIKTVKTSYRNLANSDKKVIGISKSALNIDIQTDNALAKRVIGNMVKNAIEASNTGQQITINCSENDDSIIISVHNHTVMSYEAKMQIFQRSFSTKGKGRGIGTYSMKLLMEKYLQGKISFESEEGKGTTFYAAFPKNVNIEEYN